MEGHYEYLLNFCLHLGYVVVAFSLHLITRAKKQVKQKCEY